GRSGPGRRGRGPPAGAADRRLAGKVVRAPVGGGGGGCGRSRTGPAPRTGRAAGDARGGPGRKGRRGPVLGGERRLRGAQRDRAARAVEAGRGGAGARGESPRGGRLR